VPLPWVSNPASEVLGRQWCPWPNRGGCNAPGYGLTGCFAWPLRHPQDSGRCERPGLPIMCPMAPETTSSIAGFPRIARAIRYIDAQFREQPRLAISRPMRAVEFHFIVCSAGLGSPETVSGVP